MAYYITGDCHGKFDKIIWFNRFNHKLTENDVVIFLGDVGLNYYGNESDRNNKNLLDAFPNYFFCIHGNHEELVIEGRAPIQELWGEGLYDLGSEEDDFYISFMQDLPLYHIEGNIIFVHAGIDEEAGEEWEWQSTDRDYLEKFPDETGHFDGGMTIVAGHVGTAVIAENPRFHDIYFDGESHYYIDATVYDSGVINVLMYDTDDETFYQIFEAGKCEIEPYEK